MENVKVPSKEKLKYLMDVASKYKEDVKSELNTCFELADVYFKIEDSPSERKNKPAREIDFSIITSRKFLANFTMANVFNRNNAWAKMQINKNTYLKATNQNEQIIDSFVQQANKTLETNSTTTFEYMKGSNYYTEVAKAIKDAQFGAGIYKINEQNSNTRPFSFEFMGYDNIKFTEDALGKPVIVFKEHYPMNGEDLVDRFSNYPDFKLPSQTSEEEFDQKVNVIEVMIGMFDEGTGLYKYYNAVYTAKFEECLCFRWTDYPVFIVFRWALDSSNCWGTGPARDYKDIFQSLKDNKEKRKRHRDKIIDPPGGFTGNLELMYKVGINAGDINYNGSGLPGDTVGYQPYNLGTNLIPLEQDINEARNAIQAAFLAQPLGTMDDPVRSATEQAMRIELFNKEWSTTGELINTEVLYPTFTACYMILKAKGILLDVELDGEGRNYVEFSELLYMNELTRNTGLEEVNQVLNYYGLVGSVIPEDRRDLLIKPEEFADYAADKMRIPKNVLPSKEDLRKTLEERTKQQMALLAAQGGVMSGQ